MGLEPNLASAQFKNMSGSPGVCTLSSPSCEKGVYATSVDCMYTCAEANFEQISTQLNLNPNEALDEVLRLGVKSALESNEAALVVNHTSAVTFKKSTNQETALWTPEEIAIKTNLDCTPAPTAAPVLVTVATTPEPGSSIRLPKFVIAIIAGIVVVMCCGCIGVLVAHVLKKKNKKATGNART